MYCGNHIWVEKKIVGSLASNLGILDDDFEELLAAGNLSKVWYWYNNLGLCVQTHRDHFVTWIDLDEVFPTFQ